VSMHEQGNSCCTPSDTRAGHQGTQLRDFRQCGNDFRAQETCASSCYAVTWMAGTVMHSPAAGCVVAHQRGDALPLKPVPPMTAFSWLLCSFPPDM
jgi:hypothetical protein